jgi:orotate phosphoribosyltransferase
MTNELYHLDELTAALATSGEQPIATHLSEDEFIRYATGALSATAEEAVDAHLAICPTCTLQMQHLVCQSRAWADEEGQQHLADFGQTMLSQLTRLCDDPPEPEPTEDHSADSPQRARSLRLRTPDELDVLTLLDDLGVIERRYDYVLPSGLHSDTYVNTSKLCQSEEGLRIVARAFDALFADIHFDVVVCGGWAMGMIARRLARERASRLGSPVRVVVSEGYTSPSFTEDLPQGSRALVLVDVSITGRLLERLKNGVQRYGAATVGAGCILAPPMHHHAEGQPLRTLGSLDMALADPRRSRCPRCATLRKLVFNPISSQMTVKRLVPRSPTEFLAEYPEAVTFWNAVDAARAYEHHHIEDKTHYIAFVDTAKMLKHPKVGPQVVRALLDILTANSPMPDLILVPNRSRALLLASNIIQTLAKEGRTPAIQVVRAQRRCGRWTIGENVQQQLRGADLLILDTAAGHGCVLDELSLLATDASARSISAAVLLSRLTESCENSLRQRLNGRFYRLFHLPIRPVAIRSNDRSLCPVCHQRDLIKQAATEKQDEAILQFARQSARMVKRPPRPDAEPCKPAGPSQLLLFDMPEPPLLQRCRRAVASGITLHALYAAMTDGMAPLALPELRNTQIPSQNRAAMLENLPPGVLDWSETFLNQSLEDVLADANEETIWAASADVLVREGRTYWVAYLKTLLEKSADLQTKPHDSFWNRLAYAVYRASANDADLRDEIRGIVHELLGVYGNTVAANGLGRVGGVLTENPDSTLVGTEQ